jgi:hypothetical protein
LLHPFRVRERLRGAAKIRRNLGKPCFHLNLLWRWVRPRTNTFGEPAPARGIIFRLEAGELVLELIRLDDDPVDSVERLRGLLGLALAASSVIVSRSRARAGDSGSSVGGCGSSDQIG